MMSENRRMYSKEFKEEALALLQTSGKTMHAPTIELFAAERVQR